MVYERVRWIDIPKDGGSVVSTAGGLLAKTYSTQTIDGRITKVWYDWNNAANTGSLWVFVSGTDEQIWKSLGATADVIAYPRVANVDNTNTAILTASGGCWTEYVCRDFPLYIVGSALGNATVVNKVRVYYY